MRFIRPAVEHDHQPKPIVRDKFAARATTPNTPVVNEGAAESAPTDDERRAGSVPIVLSDTTTSTPDTVTDAPAEVPTANAHCDAVHDRALDNGGRPILRYLWVWQILWRMREQRSLVGERVTSPWQG